MRLSRLRLLAYPMGASIACAALALLPAAGAAVPTTQALTNGSNWSGAVVSGSGFYSVTSTWTEPSVTCNSYNDELAIWVGLDGYGSSTLEQTGVSIDCSTGHQVYQAWSAMYPASPVYYSNAIYPGDHITGTVARSGTTYTLTISDTTRGWTKAVTRTMTASNTSAEIVLESPTASCPNFGTVYFTNSKVNGSYLSNWNPLLADASTGCATRTSAVSGGSFSITYLAE